MFATRNSDMDLDGLCYKFELSVKKIGLPVTPLPDQVRKKWSDWSSNGSSSAVNSSRKVYYLEEKQKQAFERRMARQQEIVRCAKKHSRTTSFGNRDKLQRRLLIQDKLASAEERRRSLLESLRWYLRQQHCSIEARRIAVKRRRQRAVNVLEWHWTHFRGKHKTSEQIAHCFLTTGVLTDIHEATSEELASHSLEFAASPFRRKIGTFEALASAIQSTKTIRSLQDLLERLMRWRKVFGLHKSDRLSEPLMRRLNPRVPEGRPVPHYQPRVLLSAVMICRHPDVVLSGEGEREERLKAAARRMLEGLRALVLRLAYPGRRGPRRGEPFQELLSGWDGAWVCYLSEFVLWKQKDAAALEEELIDMAVKMELSMLEKCGGDPKSPRVLASIDLKAIVDQVPEDHRLLQERIAKLTGAEGLERMKSAVSKARENFNRQHNRSREHCNTENESSVAGFACVSSMSRIPSGLHSPTWAITRDHFGFVSNEAMVHEMLYNPSWQLEIDEAETGWELAKSALTAENPLKSLPQFDVQAAQAEGDEALAASVRRHVARVAEQAFWDNVEEGLKGLGGSAPPSAVDRAASLLSELGREVAGVLPEVGEGGGVAAEVSEAFAKPELLRALESADSASAVGRLLAKATDLMRRLGSPARLDGMLEAQTAVEAQLAAASADGRGGGPTTARVTARALRLLFAQLRLLKLDSANARLRTLSSAIGGGEAARYCASRFRQRQGLPEDGPSVRADARLVAGKLPKTASWLQGARRAAVGAEQGLISAGIELPAHTAAAAAAAPERMQAGRGPASEARASGPVPPIAPAPPSSWRGSVRLGLVGLVTSEVPAAGPELAETLELDSRRLHSAQNEVQRLMVLSACMLVLRQTGSIAGRAVGPAELEAAKNRLSPILKDPSGNLRDAAAELAAASGGSEDSVYGALRAVLSPSSGALAALAGGLGSALSLYLLMPGGVDGNGPAEAEVERSLSRCGGTVLRAEVQSVAKDVAQIAAVTEAVHGAIYETLYSMDRA